MQLPATNLLHSHGDRTFIVCHL